MEPEIYDLYYEIASGVSRVVKQLIIAILFAGLCMHFMVNARARRRVWMVGAAYFVMVVVYLCIPTEVHAFTVYLVAILAAFLVLCMLEKENRQVKFLLCYIFFSVRWVASSLSTELTYFAEIRIEEWVILRSGMSQESIMRTLYFIFCGSRVIECVLTALILYGICKGIERMFFFNRNGMEKKEMLLLMLPATLGMLYFISNERNVIVVLEKTDMYLSDIVPEFTLMESAMEMILIAAIMSMLWLYQKLKQEQGKKQSDRLLLQEVRSMRTHVEEVERLHDGLRGMRHDMRNHISVLQGLMQRGAFGQAQEYLDSMGRSYTGETGEAGAVNAGGQPEGEASKYGADQAEQQSEIMTGNPVTDVILAEHRRRITEAGVLFETDFHYPDSTAVDAFDLSVILDNALTNAQEAAPQGSFIRIRSFREGQAYLIVIENAFEGTLPGIGAEGLPMTTKRPAEAHGFGLRHIKTVVERYHGAMTIEQKGNTVCLSMMLCVG